MTADIAAARVFLFVPGDRPERFDKAATSGADVVVLDLEDAVAPERKASALEHVVAWLAAGNSALIRVNGVGAATHGRELDRARSAGAGVVLPKAESVAEVARVADSLAGLPLVLLVETALGIENAHDICRVPGVTRAAFGSVDLAAQLGVDPASPAAMAWARSRLANASAAAGLPSPIDGVTTAVADDDALVADLEIARTLGFSGKLCIHPRQVARAHEELAPTAAEVERAGRIVAAAASGGVTVLDGQMIDAPVVARAQRILAAAGTN